MLDDFAVFILTHGRADNVITYRTLQRAGYTGRVYIVIDNEDKQAEKYYQNFGDKVIMFDKAAEAEKTDCGDNFPERNTVLFARNAVFDIAEGLGIEYFVVLDDDYKEFSYIFDEENSYKRHNDCKNINDIFEIYLNYYIKTKFFSICFSQGGDFIGGKNSGILAFDNKQRKVMNSFFCSTKRKFKFIARMNDDVSTYVKLGNTGLLFLTIPHICLEQVETQQQIGGLTKMYTDYGTYVKSFYTIMHQPSSVNIGLMGVSHKRLHHRIDWDTTVPCIISEQYRKT